MKAGTIGNHEFDFGLDNMARLFKMANFPIVCANYDVAGTVLEGFWVQQEDGCKIPDTFQDELAVVLVEPEGFSVLSACSHRGITNILRTVQAAFPESPCKLLLGGFHIHNAEKQKYQVIADYLQEYLPRQIGVCHCTGVDKYAFFYKDFGDSTFYNYTGKLIQTDLSE